MQVYNVNKKNKGISEMIIKNFVGGHSLSIFTDCEYDAAIRKYRGGYKIAEIPFSGSMLSAKIRQEEAESVNFEGVSIPTNTPQIFEDVDPIPLEEECDFCIVSAMYVAACKSLGIDTKRLLTIGAPVVDEENRVIGTCSLNRN